MIELKKQIKVYSVDTSYFYNENEKEIYNQLKDLQMNKKDTSGDSYRENKKKIKDLKTQLKQNIKGNNKKRVLDHSLIKDTNIISMFDSELSRAIGIEENSLSEDIIIVQTFYFDILKDLIMDGFTYKGARYEIFTASAGQIRQKKTIFIKEKTLSQIHNRITCGLSVDDINKNGGVNINKYLAYLALCSSATEQWIDFDINKVIVVDDFESNVNGMVDYIDSKTFDITRKKMDVPVPHTDGCGMMLPRVSKKSKMVRMPWVKGLLVPFPFNTFIREKRKELNNNTIGIVKDIYGKEHDILKDDIEIILTKSQFKMWRYYKEHESDIDAWDKYKNKFIEHNSTANFCNEEDDKFKNAKLNYQMLQTLTGMSKKDLTKIAQKTIQTINSIGSDRDIMMKVLGVTEFNKEKNNLQSALEIYPELLSDNYTKDVLKQVKASMVKRAKAGKLDINGKYTFLIPDLYAACENIFLGVENPKGLLENNTVFCKLYSDGMMLDCLRSPHLYREHAIRQNVVDKARSKWFITNGVYTSSHDLITKLLMNDNDGDTSLVCGDKTLVEFAKNKMKDIVPLYYEMGKAKDSKITKRNIYDGMTRAYTGGNIGEISNNISKIWNHDDPDLDMVKIQCVLNNFVIDYAKTLEKPEIPYSLKSKMDTFIREKLPHFFMYAKDKPVNRVAEKNNSIVNMLDDIIPNKRLHFNAKNTGKIDYKMLMNKSSVKPDKFDEIIDEYTKINRGKRTLYYELRKERYETGDKLYINEYIKNKLLEVDCDVDNVVDSLILHLYVNHPQRSRATLWSSFGDIIVKNLENNIDKPLHERWIMCECCGERVKVTSNNIKYCDECAKKIKRNQDLLAARRYKAKMRSES